MWPDAQAVVSSWVLEWILRHGARAPAWGVLALLLALLHDDAVGGGASEGLGEVHLLGLCGGDDEVTRGGGPGDVGVLVDALPEQGGEGLDPLVAQVLVLVPGPGPPPPDLVLALLWVLGDGAGDRQ